MTLLIVPFSGKASNEKTKKKYDKGNQAVDLVDADPDKTKTELIYKEGKLQPSQCLLLFVNFHRHQQFLDSQRARLLFSTFVDTAVVRTDNFVTLTTMN